MSSEFNLKGEEMGDGSLKVMWRMGRKMKMKKKLEMVSFNG